MKKSFTETLHYLYDLLPMYQRQGPVAIKKDLGNIEKMCWDLGLPQWQFQSIHVGGTNGKGSVASMLFSILKESGYKVGLYTSPHVTSFTERIRIDQRPIPEKEVVDFVHAHQAMIESLRPSFFELTVAMAFDYFARKEVDIAVIEVGLGGRLDSTNIINPELSVITNVSYDHMAMLGNTIEEIAGEKAGIIKRLTPVVIGETNLDTELTFLTKAGELNAPITFADQVYEVRRKTHNWVHQTLEVSKEDEGIRTYQLDLPGEYQIKNLATTLVSIDQLVEDGWNKINERSIARGLSRAAVNAGLRGRMEQLQAHPLVVCDTAHNEAGVRIVMRQIRQMNPGKLHIVWGMVDDKEHSAMISLLPHEATYYFTQPDLPRALPVATLQQKAARMGLNGNTFPKVTAAIMAALGQAGPDDLVFIGGSTFVVSEAISMMESLAPAVN